MKVYNIYYKNEKLNTFPLTDDNINNILSKKFIVKQKKNSKEVEKINIKNLHIIKCTIL